MTLPPNKSAPGKRGIRVLFHTGRACPALPEPGRSPLAPAERKIRWPAFRAGRGRVGRGFISPRTHCRLVVLPGLLLMLGLGLPGRSEESKGEKSPRQVQNSIGIKFVLIPSGKFTMGSPPDETRRNKDEEQHEVKIGKTLYLGVYEVTQEQFEKVMGFNPSYFSARATGRQGTSYEDWSKPGGGKDKVENLAGTADFPVENVSWDEAVEFCRKLSALPVEQKAGRAYRLPSEAEWEYACRGGASSYQVFHFGNSISSEQANFRGTEPYGGAARGAWLERTCKVGSYKPNAFGLYDMHGNVWEWCSDPYEYEGDRGFRVRRGGSWGEGGEQCRSAIRLRRAPEDHRWNLGFRVVLVAREVEQQ